MEEKRNPQPRPKPTAGSHFIAGLIALAVLVWLTMIVWNGLVPVLFYGPEFTYSDALLLWLLPNLVLHGFRIVKWAAR